MYNLELLDSLFNHIIINIKGCSYIEHDNNWHEVGSKVDYDLWIVLDGIIKISYHDQEYIAKKYDIIFLYPGVLYKATTLTEKCKFIYVHFDFKIGNNLRGLNDFNLEGHIPGIALDNEVKSFIQSFWDFNKKGLLSSMSLKGYFIVLLSRIIIQQYKQKNKIIIEKTKKSKITRLQPALEYISIHLNEQLKIKELASLCGMSEKYFITFFKKAIGITPGKYIIQLKMNRALDYIYECKYSIKEIAYFLGYPDQYTFSKSFKNYYKASPSRYI